MPPLSAVARCAIRRFTDSNNCVIVCAIALCQSLTVCRFVNFYHLSFCSNWNCYENTGFEIDEDKPEEEYDDKNVRIDFDFFQSTSVACPANVTVEGQSSGFLYAL